MTSAKKPTTLSIENIYRYWSRWRNERAVMWSWKCRRPLQESCAVGEEKRRRVADCSLYCNSRIVIINLILLAFIYT